jgi:hypothetical protein
MYRRRVRGYSATIDIGKYPVPETEQEQEQSLCGLLLDIIKITLCGCCRLAKHSDDADDDYESCDEMACAIGDSDSEEEYSSGKGKSSDSGSDSSFIEAKGCSSDSDYD